MTCISKSFYALACALLITFSSHGQERARDYGFTFGVMSPGEWNAITDVDGVMVGHQTLVKGDSVRTGVTAVLPHGGNIFQEKVPGAVYVGNGFGKLAGTTQVEELGNIETPIVLTNTLSVAAGIEGVIDYTLAHPENAHVRSVNAVVGETNDGYLNDIRGRHVRPSDVVAAIQSAQSGNVEEGNVGAGTGTICFGFKGGIGTASRKLPAEMGGYTVGVLVQTNFGGVLQIDGLPVGKELGQYAFKNQLESADGSCMIVVATDAPVHARNLKRIAKRAIMGLAKTGGIASNGSGDYVVAFSTAEGLRVPYDSNGEERLSMEVVNNDYMSGLFLATIEATEEAIINSLFAAENMKGSQGHEVNALPIEKVLEMKK
ncbi:S58 family peptidase [Echinicola strongylocentroti]|uniref:S58 family peptidase n=2 Tax=Echinicola strongylocentroti TaxID=1795355 RepID=A0A2Z4IR25_9BACT|nr:P1 family peptidase [Echinicola strongylocentroti]AWW33179.1 S58 family peptidase [Echinicola strongylocentroti]